MKVSGTIWVVTPLLPVALLSNFYVQYKETQQNEGLAFFVHIFIHIALTSYLVTITHIFLVQKCMLALHLGEYDNKEDRRFVVCTSDI